MRDRKTNSGRQRRRPDLGHSAEARHGPDHPERDEHREKRQLSSNHGRQSQFIDSRDAFQRNDGRAQSAKRDRRRKQSLEEALASSTARLQQCLAADQSTPSQNLQRQEQSLRLAEALAELPEAQREALILQHWHGWSVTQIAEHMKRSRAAVAGLLKRGLRQLREALVDWQEF